MLAHFILFFLLFFFCFCTLQATSHLKCYEDQEEEEEADFIPFLEFCKKEGLDFEKCLISAFEDIRPYLRDGYRRFNIRSIENVAIDDSISQVVGHMTLKMFNFTAHGLSDYFVRSVNIDNILRPTIEIHHPKVKLIGNYTLNGNLLQFPLISVKGKGPVTINITDCTYKAVLTTKLYTENGIKKFEFTNVYLRITVDGGRISIETLKNGRNTNYIGPASYIINEHFYELIAQLVPSIEELSKNLMLDVSNTIAQAFNYDDFFYNATTDLYN